MKSDFLIALTQLAAERHLPREQVLQAIEVALASAFKKDNPASGQNISVKLNPNTGEVSVYALKTVVQEVEDSDREISVADAKYIKNGVDLGDEVAAEEPLPHNASRIAAQTAKQVVLQRLREAERELLYQEFLQHEEDIISGVIDQTESGRTIVLDLGRAQSILPYEEQVPNERYRKGQRIKVYVVSVRNAPKGPEILVSRSHRNMLKRLFEIEVPEVYIRRGGNQGHRQGSRFPQQGGRQLESTRHRPGRLLHRRSGQPDPKHRQRAPGRED
jgi:N utilization substance protein A